MKRRTRQATPKLIALLLIPIIALSLVGIAHSLWSESLYIEGTVNMGYWKACVKIKKTLDGSFTDPETGAVLTVPTNLIAISADFPTKFKLTITVKNCESTTLTNVIVTDTILTNVAPIDWTKINERHIVKIFGIINNLCNYSPVSFWISSKLSFYYANPAFKRNK